MSDKKLNLPTKRTTEPSLKAPLPAMQVAVQGLDAANQREAIALVALLTLCSQEWAQGKHSSVDEVKARLRSLTNAR